MTALVWFLWTMSKEYNVLIDKLPLCITLFEKDYPVYTSFKNWIEISLILEDGGLDDALNLAKILKLCYKEKLPENIGSAILGMLSFLNGDTEFFVSPDKKSNQRLYSFRDDADVIFASFYKEYGIDLEKSDMHWYKFLALFRGLSDENPFKTLLKIRTADETKIKDAEKRRKLRELKSRYEIKSNVEIDVAKNISSLF